MNTNTKAIALGDIQASTTNPRKHLNIDELVESVRTHGVLQPILVRPIKGGIAKFEIVAGHRRFAAASKAGLDEVPAAVRELTDEQAVELQVIENLERTDLHPIEEAEGYRTLMTVHKYDVHKIAARIGKSVKYVYDRIKLLTLTKDAKRLFLENRFTPGHAILLARLSPEDQKQALDPYSFAVFTPAGGLFDPYHEDVAVADGLRIGYRDVKPTSVREFKGWIDKHVRFDTDKVDPVLFPDTAKSITDAVKVVPITFDHQLDPSTRKPGTRTLTVRSWERADGEHGSKTCEHSVTGVVVAGPRRGEAFAVCTAKDLCTVHWSKWQKDRAQRQKARSGAGKAEGSGYDHARERVRWAARDEAQDEIRKETMKRTAKMTDQQLLRALIGSSPWSTGRYLADTKQVRTRQSEQQVAAWAKRAPMQKIREAAAYLDDGDLSKLVGVGAQKIEKRHIDQALAKYDADRKAKAAEAKAKRAPKRATRKATTRGKKK